MRETCELYEKQIEWVSSMLINHPSKHTISGITIPFPKVVNNLLSSTSSVNDWKRLLLNYIKIIKKYIDSPIVEYGPIYLLSKKEMDDVLKKNINSIIKYLEDLEGFVCNETWNENNIKIKNEFLEWIISIKSIYMELNSTKT